MKKTLLLIVGMIVLIGTLAACSGNNEDIGEDVNEINDKNYVVPGVILEDIDNEETFAFVISDKECPACQTYKENALKTFEETNPGKIRSIEINNIQSRSDELEDIQTLIIDHLDEQFNATPTTYFIVNGELANIDVGVMEYEDLLSKYELYIEQTETNKE